MTFENWIENIIKSEEPSDEVIAYNFGIFETPNGYSLYLVGSKEYDEDNYDWASNNDFEPSQKYFPLPEEFADLEWQDVQEKVGELLQKFITSDQYKNSFFSKAKAIATGFDDGDLMTLKINHGV